MAKLRILPDDVTAFVSEGRSVLETSLSSGVPHAHVCGGHARCSTCRVFVLSGLETCGPRTDAEEEMAKRLHFPSAIRLACQLRPSFDLSVRRLVLDDDDIALTSQVSPEGAGATVGEEKRVAIVFTDLRGFTSFASAVPAFDAVHVLGRHFRAMSRVISARGGQVHNAMGDGLLVLFAGATPRDACVRAVRAALDMLDAQRAVSAYVEELYARALDMGIGIHFGEIVLGAIRIGSELRSSVIGDAVNVASRIESANKELGTRLLVSDVVREAIGASMTVGVSAELALRGKDGTFRLSEVLALGPNGA